jgi:deoxyhypusine monooxygenase
MQLNSAIPHLEKVLNDKTELPIVRHECAEALGAIADPSVLPILTRFINDPSREVRETVEIAIGRVNHSLDKTLKNESNYKSIDPAFPLKEQKTVAQLQDMLLDTTLPLYKRYQAMFSLRNIGTEEAVLALALGLKDSSALFKHEIGTTPTTL